MINFSKVGLIADLISAVNALPASTSSATEDDVAFAKQAAITKLNRIKTNGAHINMRVNSIGQWSQTEIQTSGQTIKVAPPAAPVVEPAK
jgi:hypothetical protein